MEGNRSVSASSPLITFVIPCYNSAAYMDRCIGSIADVISDRDIEILIIDDGSSDEGKTLSHAEEWVRRDPERIHAIHQENGGPGEAINTSLARAHGTYFKVVDSDDWLDPAALGNVLKQIRLHREEIDLFVCNYVYEYEDGTPGKPVRYTHEYPQQKPFRWDDMLHPFPIWRYMMMHSVIYRTDVLRECGLHLPAHTFYVDEIVIYAPLPHVHTLMYLNEDLYRYLIGRADQSVNEEIMASRCDQQVRIGRIKIDAVDIASVPSRNLRRYLTADLTITMCFCTVFTTLSSRPDHWKMRDEIWAYLRQKDEHLWHKIRWSFIGWWCNLRSPLGVRAFKWGYRTVRNIFRFN